MKASLRKFLDTEVAEFCLCPLSIAEIVFKWQKGKLPGVPDPNEWIPHSLINFQLLTVTPSVCMQAGTWDWPHGDLIDRLLAAMAKESDIPLVHTDKVLKQMKGFPQMYFPNQNIT